MDVYDFGIRLKKLREARKISQGKLSKILGIDRTTISSYERDRIAPSAIVVKRAAIYFNVTTDYLLGISETTTLNLDGFSESGKQTIMHIVDEIKNLMNEDADKDQAE